MSGTPDLPPQVARYQPSWTSTAAVCGALVLVCLAYVALRGGTQGAGTGIAVVIGGSALLLVLKQRLLVVAAGPGWLSVREAVRTRVVRTDRLARLEVTASGLEQVLTLVDEDGGRVGVTRTDLRADRALLRQVRQDVGTSLERGLQAPDRALELLGLR